MRRSLLVIIGVVFIFVAMGNFNLVSAKKNKTGGGKVIRLEAIKVEGRIQKPQAFYILQRSNLNFKALELKKSFVPEIERSVKKDPF